MRIVPVFSVFRRLLLLLPIAVAACSAVTADEDATSVSSATGACGGEGSACCTTGARCKGELGCSGNVCRSIVTDMVAYAEYCKEELGFTNPKAKLPYMSCFDSVTATGTRASGRQALLTLARQPLSADNWDAMFGNGVPAEGCDQPNYLQDRCDPYYRLNVFNPDPGNDDIVAALHCRSDGAKPSPASAITAAARLDAFEASTEASASERTRLFDLWNGSNEIVLTMTNLRTGKACFFHAATPYFGSHLPAPDDETNLSAPGALDRVWDDLPVKPPYGKDDETHRTWFRNGETAWQKPDFMRCTNCHDSGPFMHDPFIDSMGEDYLPRDRRTRPYIPLGYQGQFDNKMVKTGPVRTDSGGTTGQRCTSCHAMGSERACGSWFDRALGWYFPPAASAESKRDQSLARYMPIDHGVASTAEFYEEYGHSIDAMKCCCEHSSWQGCTTVPAATPQGEGTAGTGARSCTESTCGAWKQDCCDGGSCNHTGLTCVSGKCRFKDEQP